MQVMVNVPDQYFLDISVSELAGRLKLSTALLMFQAGHLSTGAACEFAGVDRYTFLEACQKYGIDVINYEPDEIEADFAALTQSEAEAC
jgi:predicted HTH domain antitoxin